MNILAHIVFLLDSAHLGRPSLPHPLTHLLSSQAPGPLCFRPQWSLSLRCFSPQPCPPHLVATLSLLRCCLKLLLGGLEEVLLLGSQVRLPSPALDIRPLLCSLGSKKQFSAVG